MTQKIGHYELVIVKYFKYLMVFVTALVFDVITVESFKFVVEDIFNIHEDEMRGFVYWGDTFVSRIIASLLGTFVGCYIIGSYFSQKRKLATNLYMILILSFWAFSIYLYYYLSTIPELYGSPDFSTFSSKKLIPIFTFILTIPTALFASYIGSKSYLNFNRTNSLLNIKWYDLIWFFFIYQFSIALIFMLFFSIFYGMWIGNNPLENTFSLLFSNSILTDFFSYLSLSFILIASISILNYIYVLISNKGFVRFKFFKILSSLIYFWMLFVFVFNLPDLIKFNFETASIIDDKIEIIPKNYIEFVNFSIVIFSTYISEKSIVKVLRSNKLINNFFLNIRVFRKDFFSKVFSKFRK
tara:strand:- start:1135 stop:2199 length:1065 start_codon:yes stop_codon:yes gene_type:complete